MLLRNPYFEGLAHSASHLSDHWGIFLKGLGDLGVFIFAPPPFFDPTMG